MKTIPVQLKSWSLSFDIKPLGITVGDYASIIHLTTGKNAGEHGARTPGVWFDVGTTTLNIHTTINNDPNAMLKQISLPINKYTTIQIKQVRDNNNQYMCELWVNETREYSILNSKPRSFTNVTVYVGDPWYPPANAMIKNFNFTNLS